MMEENSSPGHIFNIQAPIITLLMIQVTYSHCRRVPCARQLQLQGKSAAASPFARPGPRTMLKRQE